MGGEGFIIAGGLYVIAIAIAVGLHEIADAIRARGK